MALEAITGLNFRENHFVRGKEEDPASSFNGALECCTNFEVPYNFKVCTFLNAIGLHLPRAFMKSLEHQ